MTSLSYLNCIGSSLDHELCSATIKLIGGNMKEVFSLAKQSRLGEIVKYKDEEYKITAYNQIFHKGNQYDLPRIGLVASKCSDENQTINFDTWGRFINETNSKVFPV